MSSDRASEVDDTGSRFRVKLNPPIDIPREAAHTRVFVQEASVVYSMKNVNATNNTFRVQLGLPAVGSLHVHTLTGVVCDCVPLPPDFVLEGLRKGCGAGADERPCAEKRPVYLMHDFTL